MSTEKGKLIVSLAQVDNLIKVLEDNPYGKYLQTHLYPVKYELERQLNNLLIVNTKKESVTDQ